MNTELPVVSELIPIEQYNLALEEEFIQAGQVLLEIGRKAFLGLGELVAWKMARECAEDEASRSALIARYANAWGVSRANLVKAVVIVTKFPEVERAEDLPPTVTYEVLSGSASAAEAEAGMRTAIGNGWGAADVREAKLLKARGLTPEGEWQRPQLFCRDNVIWLRDAAGAEVWLAQLNPELSEIVQRGIALLRYRARV
ncbi:MAG: hypothetical protein GX601_07985 [Anaerolineales bacterium]|nr:hypothetical protein [Anaerolineales bacterium]